ncbi:hypothetical protein JTB14_035176 [Gonioctena quinquepunctata]|nr:hypothetical protein JTB14_035176 [Gonioctena quinquepunctata]
MQYIQWLGLCHIPNVQEILWVAPDYDNQCLGSLDWEFLQGVQRALPLAVNHTTIELPCNINVLLKMGTQAPEMHPVLKKILCFVLWIRLQDPPTPP